MGEAVSRRTSRPEEWDGQAALSLHSLVAAARRQIWWLAGTAGLVVLFTLVFTLRQRPVYEAQATLRVEQTPTQTNPTDLLTALQAPSTIETETEILRSRSVAEDVVDSLGLRAAVMEPADARRERLFEVLRVTPDAPAGSYVVRRDTAGFTLTAPDARVTRGTFGAPATAAGVTVEPRRSGPERIELEVGSRSTAAAQLRDALHVTRPQANAAILSVSYQSTDPVLARDVVNAVASSYIALRNAFQKQQARAAVDFLNQQVAAIGAELAQAETALEQFRRTHFVIDPDAQASAQVSRLADLQAKREELRGQRSQLRDLLARARRPADSAGSWADFVGAPALITSPAMSGIVQQLSTVEADRARLLSWRTAKDPDLEADNRTIATLRTRLADLVQSQLAGLDDAQRSADSTLARFDTTLQRVPEVQLQYARLRRQVDLDTQLYTLLQTRLKESEISEAMEVANIQVVDPAIVPRTPVGPRRMMNLLFGGAGGLLLGLLVTLVREGADTRVRSREEVVRLTNLPLLASIPRIAAPNGRRRHHAPAEQIETRLVIRHSPRSPAAEAYRALRTNVAFAATQRERPVKTMVVTSPEPRDGKSTTAVNFATTLAEQGHRVLLIAADLRRPVLHTVLHQDRAPGMAEVLNGTAPLEAAVHAIPLPAHATGRLDFMGAGKSIPNPAEQLGAPETQHLLAGLAERYDAVVLDTPPLSVVTDAAVLGRMADGVILVARMGSTHTESLKRAVEELDGIGVRVVGTVLTDVHHTEDRYGYRYGYDQYYYYYTSDEDDAEPRKRLRKPR